jgi:hypothetical protein
VRRKKPLVNKYLKGGPSSFTLSQRDLLSIFVFAVLPYFCCSSVTCLQHSLCLSGTDSHRFSAARSPSLSRRISEGNGCLRDDAARCGLDRAGGIAANHLPTCRGETRRTSAPLVFPSRMSIFLWIGGDQPNQWERRMNSRRRAFPLLVNIVDTGGNARIGANGGARGYADRYWYAKRRVHPRFLRLMGPPFPERLGATPVGSWPREEQLAPGPGTASRRGQYRPTGRRLHQSDLALTERM